MRRFGGSFRLCLLLGGLSLAGCSDNTLVDNDFSSGEASPRPSLTPEPEPTPTPPLHIDQDGDGVYLEDDCDDTDASVFPGAKEQCDELDNDCNGVVDEGVRGSYYLDLDGDGYGSDSLVATGCLAPEGYVESRGDCDDDDTGVHPGAEDEADDGQDQDCGGSDEADPAADPPEIPEPGAPPEDQFFTTIQQAIDAAKEGAVIWVPPGEYPEYDITFRGKAVTVISTGGPDVTVVNAGGKGRGFIFENGEGAGSVLDGFTIMNGDHADGGGVFVKASSPVLRNLVVRENFASFGGGLYLAASSPAIIGCLIEQNGARVRGGGIFVNYSAPTIRDSTITGNHGTYAGGGLDIELTSDPVITGSVISGNDAWFGAGVYVSYSGARIESCVLSGNKATDLTGGGGGMYLDSSSVEVFHATFYNNSSSRHGGGLYSWNSSPVLSNVLITSNRAAGNGGGVFVDTSELELSHALVGRNLAGESGGGIDAYDSAGVIFNAIIQENGASSVGGGLDLWESDLDLKQCTIAGNSADGNGGGLYLFGSSTTPLIHNSILAYNEPTNVYNNREDLADPTVLSSVIYNPWASASHNLEGLDESNLSDEPGFLDYDEDGLPVDFHLAKTSALIDAGDPDELDPDGSRSDIGSYGGMVGNLWDLDGDGLPNWFWPGSLLDAPEGFDPKSFDCNDGDALIQHCR